MVCKHEAQNECKHGSVFGLWYCFLQTLHIICSSSVLKSVVFFLPFISAASAIISAQVTHFRQTSTVVGRTVAGFTTVCISSSCQQDSCGREIDLTTCKSVWVWGRLHKSKAKFPVRGLKQHYMRSYRHLPLVLECTPGHVSNMS